MIRLGTAIWIVLAGVVGYGLYHLKHEVQALEDELGRLNRQIFAEHQNIHVLKAEWSYINQPHRLEALAQKHLDLTPLVPKQIARVSDLGPRPADMPMPIWATPEGATPSPAANATATNTVPVALFNGKPPLPPPPRPGAAAAPRPTAGAWRPPAATTTTVQPTLRPLAPAAPRPLPPPVRPIAHTHLAGGPR